jgi:hypothetical protein
VGEEGREGVYPQVDWWWWLLLFNCLAAAGTEGALKQQRCTGAGGTTEGGLVWKQETTTWRKTRRIKNPGLQGTRWENQIYYIHRRVGGAIVGVARDSPVICSTRLRIMVATLAHMEVIEPYPADNY